MTAWFARVGLPLSPVERASVEAWTRGAPSQGAAAWRAVATWPEASSIVRAMDLDATWWDLEEAERETLWMRASEVEGEAELLRRLTALSEGIAGVVRAHVATTLARAGPVDPAVGREAASAALLAAHQDALRRMAGAEDSHGFAQKYALFTGGRWPLGYHFGSFLIF